MEDAENFFYSQRDDLTGDLITDLGDELNLDYSLDSLKRLERWYFDELAEMRGRSLDALAKSIGFYFAEVLCRSGGFQWLVSEFVFKPGTYEIGVIKGRVQIMVTAGRLPEKTGNKRMQSLFREAKRWLDGHSG